MGLLLHCKSKGGCGFVKGIPKLSKWNGNKISLRRTLSFYLIGVVVLPEWENWILKMKKIINFGRDLIDRLNVNCMETKQI